MKIFVSLKHAGNLTKKVKTVPFCLSKTPETLQELIEESVHSCLISYRERADHARCPKPLTEEEWNGMQEIGKFAFGVHYNQNLIDEQNAIETAIDAWKDGLVRIFRGTAELCDLDGALEIHEGDLFTFVKLTMLSGRMW